LFSRNMTQVKQGDFMKKSARQCSTGHRAAQGPEPAYALLVGSSQTGENALGGYLESSAVKADLTRLDGDASAVFSPVPVAKTSAPLRVGMRFQHSGTQNPTH